jgi:D-aminopeptidase
MVAVAFDEKQIDAAFAELDQCYFPGATVGIAISGSPVYRKGFGLANMELPAILLPSSRMRLGSITKHFVSLAYLLLCEEGKSAIDDPIGRYLPELHPVTYPITMRQLMGHLSGLRDSHDICYQFSGIGQAVSSADLLSLYRQIDDVNDAPGSTWNYNNGGYLMLSTAIERITGRPLEVVLLESIFEPAGMYDTMLRRWDTDFVPNSAALHMANDDRFEKAILGTSLAGEGGMVSTVDDMLRWLSHMDTPAVGTNASWNVMKTPQILANGTSTGYGLGLVADRYRGVETLSHAGGLIGCNAHMIKVPAAGLDVVVMVNRHDVSSTLLTNKILDICLPSIDSTKEPSAPVATGVFRSHTTGKVIELGVRDGRQMAAIDGQDMPIDLDEDGRWRPIGALGYVKQRLTLKGESTKPASIELNEYGNLDTLVREKSPIMTRTNEIIGRFCSETTGTEAVISDGGGSPCLTTLGRFGSVLYRLECLAEDIWRAKSRRLEFLGGVLSFCRDRGAFRFSSGRTKALIFRRVP